MAITQLSQKDYLKKYLSSNTDDKKKKKKKRFTKAAHERFRVVDDDIDLKNMRPLDADELDLYHLAEDGPQIAGIIDERPDDTRALEEFRGSKRWKIMSDEYGMEDIKVTAIGTVNNQVVAAPLRSQRTTDLSPKREHDPAKKSNKHTDSDSSPVRKYQDDSDASHSGTSKVLGDSDASPLRKSNTQADLDELSPRKSSKANISNFSPPRKYKHDLVLSPKRTNLEVSPLRKEKDKRDLSPVRKNKHVRDLSPVRKNKHDVDLSPVSRKKNDTDSSPVRKSKHDTGLSYAGKKKSETEKPVSTQRKPKYDISPPRKNKYHSDLSPPRKSRTQNDSDTSPPRKSRRSEGGDESPPRNARKHNNKANRNHGKYSDSDTSPPRKTSRHYGSPSAQSGKDSSRVSLSLKISRNNDSDHSGKSRKYERHESLSIKSKQADFRESNRQNKNHSLIMGSISPSRQCDRGESPRRKDKQRSSPDSPPRKTRGPAHSGNSCSDNSPQQISKRPRNISSPSSNARKKSDSEGRVKVEEDNGQDRRDKMKGKMDKTLDGKRAGLQVARELGQEISDFKRREDELFAQMGDKVSGRGATVVMRDRKTGKRRNLEEEAKQKQEEDEKMAQHREKYSRWGKGLKQVEEQKENVQQALHEMSKPLARYADDDDLEQHLRNQEREGDPMLDYIRSKNTEETPKSKLKYEGSFLPNRFGIPPGHRWDGVDRSSGYEKQWFEKQNARRAVEEEAYKWSTSDM